MAKSEEQASEPVEVKSGAIKVSEPRSSRLAPMWNLEREFERAFNNFFSRDWLHAPHFEFPKLETTLGDKSPSINVVDRDNDLVVEAELPGVAKEDLDISMTENSLTIKGTTRREKETEEGDYQRREISTSFYSRTIPLPAVVSDNVKSEFKDGVLKLTLPKAEQSKRINIKVD